MMTKICVSRYITIQNKDAALKTLHEGIIFLLDKQQVINIELTLNKTNLN